VRARVALGFIARRLGSAGLRCSSDGGDCRAACSRTRGHADSRKSSEEDDTAAMEKAAEGRQRFSVFLFVRSCQEGSRERRSYRAMQTRRLGAPSSYERQGCGSAFLRE
jgi:hypothetical protein